jgi:hypothetical protein
MAQFTRLSTVPASPPPGARFPDFVRRLLAAGPQSARSCIDAWFADHIRDGQVDESGFAALAHAVFCAAGCSPIVDTPEKLLAVARLDSDRMSRADWRVFDEIRFRRPEAAAV